MMEYNNKKNRMIRKYNDGKNRKTINSVRKNTILKNRMTENVSIVSNL